MKTTDRLLNMAGDLARRRELQLLAFCVAVSLGLLYIHATSSPLYAFNDWADPNAFLSVGKGMLQGMVPYRDLFEQKGPLLYLLHAVAYLFDRTGFFGVYLLEASCLTATLYLSTRLCRLYLPQLFAWLLPPVMAFVMVTSRAFVSGDSAEELCTPLVLGLFCLLIDRSSGKLRLAVDPARAFWAGFLGGLVLMVKYVMLGSWIGFLLVLIILLLVRRQFKKLLKMLFMALVGLMVSIAPWLVYFAWHGAIKEFIKTYFLLNFQIYDQSSGLADRIRLTLTGTGQGLETNLLMTSILAAGLLAALFRKPPLKDPGLRAALVTSIAVQLMLSYAGGRDYTYYYLALSPFLIFGLIALARILSPVDLRVVRSRRFKIMLVVDLMVVLIGLSLIMSPNLYQSRIRAESYPQIAFARIIRSVPDSTLLNYGFLDGGFYTAADITPQNKYFMLNNIYLTDMYYEQARYIAEALPTFVVVRTGWGMTEPWSKIPHLYDHYDLVAEQGFVYTDTGYPYNYLLFQKKESLSISPQ